MERKNMGKKISTTLSAALLGAIGGLLGVNVPAATAAPADATALAEYHWKYIGNDVYHCAPDGDLFNCEPESAHSWS